MIILNNQQLWIFDQNTILLCSSAQFMLYVLLYKYIQNIKRWKHSIKSTIGTQHALTNTLATLALVFQKEWVLLKD